MINKTNAPPPEPPDSEREGFGGRMKAETPEPGNRPEVHGRNAFERAVQEIEELRQGEMADEVTAISKDPTLRDAFIEMKSRQTMYCPIKGAIGKGVEAKFYMVDTGHSPGVKLVWNGSEIMLPILLATKFWAKLTADPDKDATMKTLVPSRVNNHQDAADVVQKIQEYVGEKNADSVSSDVTGEWTERGGEKVSALESELLGRLIRLEGKIFVIKKPELDLDGGLSVATFDKDIAKETEALWDMVKKLPADKVEQYSLRLAESEKKMASTEALDVRTDLPAPEQMENEFLLLLGKLEDGLTLVEDQGIFTRLAAKVTKSTDGMMHGVMDGVERLDELARNLPPGRLEFHEQRLANLRRRVIELMKRFL